MHPLSLTLLGPFQARYNRQPLPGFRTKATQALLIFLAVQPDQASSRERLMALLWPGMPQKSARANLRQTLYQLRQAIPEVKAKAGTSGRAAELVIANRQEIQLNPAAEVDTDVVRFEALLARSAAHQHPDLMVCADCRHDLEEAAGLYQDHFLIDFYLEDSDEFEDWAQARRERYRRKALDALETLTHICFRQGAYPEAQAFAERQLEIDNLRESAYRQLMELLANSGRREEALAVYERCRRFLVEELGMEPSARTSELYAKIQAGDLTPHSPVAQGVRGLELREVIGEGSYGVIHRAFQPSVGRDVAVKVIRQKLANDPEFIRRFEAEAQIVARLEHPYIVPLYDYWRDPQGAYLVMRYVREGSLEDALKAGPWDVERAGRMVEQIASALATAHQQGVIHRDLKPANILLDEVGNSYLTDFGIAKDLTVEAGMTVEGAIIGTLDYVSPEQIKNEPISPQTDVYSFGSVLYETLTGEKPFGDSSVANLIFSHLNEPIPQVSASRPGLPPDVDDVLQKATAKRPGDRFESVLELAEAFRRALGGPEGVIGKVGELAEQPAVPLVAEPYNPYKGLRAFQEADADDFFGRDNLVERLVARLIPSLSSGSRFLALVGPSGSGKSSAVKAGLIPALRAGAIPGSEKWFVAEMVPGAHPLGELELALLPLAVDPPPSLVAPMERDLRGVLRTIRRILPDEEGSGAQLLLVIDQFEELFTLVKEPERRAFFLDSLLAALNAPRSPLRLVITLRADFYDRPLQQPQWGQLLKENTEVILPLSQAELTWTVREPARRMGVALEEGLAEAIVADVADQSGGLPLLQYALTELFDFRQDGLMTWDAYREIGGVLGALGRRAEELYAGLGEPGRETARQMFLRLVTIGESAEDTRRRVSRRELEAITGAHGGQATGKDGSALNRQRSVIDSFGAARLLTFDREPLTREPTVEVAHEALLHEWDRLRGWLAESRNDVRMQRMLAGAAAEWRRAGDDSYLLRGARLEQFAGWAELSTVALTRDEQDFLDASLAGRRARQAEEEARRQRELETARQLAETERKRAEEQARSAGRLRQRAIFLAGALFVAAILAIAALFFARQSNENAQAAEVSAALASTRETEALREAEQRATAQAQAEEERVRADAEREIAVAAQAEAQAEAEVRATAEAVAVDERGRADEQRLLAEEQARLARSRELAAASTTGLGIDPELSMLLAIEALSVADTAEAQNALHAAVLGSRLRERLVAHDGPIFGAAYSPDGSLMAMISGDGTASVWDAVSGQRLLAVPFNDNLLNNGAFLQVSFSQDGARLATVDPGDTLSLSFWDTSSGQRLEQLLLPIETAGMADYELNYSWTRLAVGYLDGKAEIWDLASGQLAADLPGHSDYVEPYFSPDGRWLATASSGSDRKILVWDADTATLIRRLNIEGAPLFVAMSPDGRWLALGDTSNAVQVWDLEAPGDGSDQVPFARLTGHENLVFGLAFSPDSRLLASSGLDSTARLWDFSTGENTLTLRQSAGLPAVTFRPDGQRLLAGNREGDALIWDLTPQGSAERLAWQGHSDNIFALSISPNGDSLATASFDGTARIWDAATGQELQLLDGHLGWRVMDVAFHPKGGRLATAGTDGTARIWDSETGEELLRLEGHGPGAVGDGLYPGVLGVAFSPDGERLATAGADRTARVWDAATGQELMVLEDHREPLTSVAFSPDGRLLATGGEEAAVHIWSAETGERIITVPADHGGRVTGIEFSPDGHFLATSGFDRMIRVWFLDVELRTAELATTIAGHANTVHSVRFSPDGQVLATATVGDVRLWDFAGLEDITHWRDSLPELLALPGGPGLAFSLDGSELIVGNQDGTLRVFTMVPDKLIELARSRLTRTFTNDECAQFRIEPCPALAPEKTTD